MINNGFSDAQAYKQAYDSTLSACGDLKQEVINNQIVICQSDSVITAKDDHIAFKTSVITVKENDIIKLEGELKNADRWNTFWRTLAGSAIFVVGVETIKDLR